MRCLAARKVVLPDGPEGLRVAPALIRIEGARIAAVEPLSPGDYGARVAEAGAEDLGALLLSPAFVDGHTHLSLTSLRGTPAPGVENMVESLFFPIEAALTAADVRAFSRLAAYESLLSGVGMVFDHYYFGVAVAEGLSEAGLSALVAPTLQDLAGPGADRWEAGLADTAALDAPAWADKGIFAALGPHASDTVSGSLWEQAAAMAEARRLPIHAHLAQSAEEYERVQAREGLSPAAWIESLGVLRARCLLVHGLYLSEADLRRLRGAEATLGFCPHSQLIFGHMARVDRWAAHGLRYLVATDCAPSNDGMSAQKELRIAAAAAHTGVSWSAAAEDFLRTGRVEDAARIEATRRTAAAARPSPKELLSRLWSIPGQLAEKAPVGRIAPGQLANLAAWDLSHPNMWPAEDPLWALAMSEPAPALYAMWVAGRPVGTPGDMQGSLLNSPAYREAKAEAEARRAELFSRAGLR